MQNDFIFVAKYITILTDVIDKKKDNFRIVRGMLFVACYWKLSKGMNNHKAQLFESGVIQNHDQSA
jgi:hypothetical protein